MSVSDHILDQAAKHYAAKFQERERATRTVAFEAGARWRQNNPHPAFPEALPAEIDTTWCSPTNPCPTRPKRLLGRYLNRPWRCPTCTRWWVTKRGANCADYDSGGHYTWVRAEADR